MQPCQFERKPVRFLCAIGNTGLSRFVLVYSQFFGCMRKPSHRAIFALLFTSEKRGFAFRLFFFTWRNNLVCNFQVGADSCFLSWSWVVTFLLSQKFTPRYCRYFFSRKNEKIAWILSQEKELLHIHGHPAKDLCPKKVHTVLTVISLFLSPAVDAINFFFVSFCLLGKRKNEDKGPLHKMICSRKSVQSAFCFVLCARLRKHDSG